MRSAPQSRSVNTAKVATRRRLRLESVDHVLSEVERLVEAEQHGLLVQLGNWTLGQTLGHLAAWAEYSYTGLPFDPPFFIRWLVRLQKRRFLEGPMPAGVKIPRVAGGTYAIEPVSLDDSWPRFRQVLRRLETEAPTLSHKLLGPLTHEEWVALNLRHCELHLGFFVPRSDGDGERT